MNGEIYNTQNKKPKTFYPCNLKKQKQLLLGSPNGLESYEFYDIYDHTIRQRKKKVKLANMKRM